MARITLTIRVPGLSMGPRGNRWERLRPEWGRGSSPRVWFRLIGREAVLVRGFDNPPLGQRMVNSRGVSSTLAGVGMTVVPGSTGFARPAVPGRLHWLELRASRKATRPREYGLRFPSPVVCAIPCGRQMWFNNADPAEFATPARRTAATRPNQDASFWQQVEPPARSRTADPLQAPEPTGCR